MGHACATRKPLLTLDQKVCQHQADIDNADARLAILASGAILASRERARLADAGAAARTRMARMGMADAT